MLNGEWQNDRFLSGEIQRTVIDLTGEPQEKTVVPSVETVVVEPDVAKRLTKVTVLGVTSEIDENISPMNIRKGKTILGVEGNLEPDKPDQSKVVSPSVEEQVVRADTGYELASVTVEGVTSDIDENIQADNIRYGVEILGVVGTMEQKEDLDAELTEQDTLLNELDSQIDTLPDREIDLSQTTATAEDVLEGKEFYNVSGEKVAGTYKDMLQRLIDDKKSCQSLFANYPTEIPYLSRLDMSAVTNMSVMFGNYGGTSLDVTNFDTSNVTKMNSMFNGCPNLTSVDLSSFNTSNVTDISYMFYNCKKLTSVDLSNKDTSNVTDMRNMFTDCYDLKSVNLSGCDFSSVTSLRETFMTNYDLGELNLENANFSNVTSLYYTFYMNNALKVLDLRGFTTSKITQFYYPFQNLTSLETILGDLDVGSAGTGGWNWVTSIFSGDKNLKNVTLKNIKQTIGIGSGTSWGTLLTNETLINTAQELWDNTDEVLGGSRKLTLSTTSKNNIANIYVKLIDITDEMIANDPYISNKKPCVVCESTDEGAMTLTEYVISKNWAIA